MKEATFKIKDDKIIIVSPNVIENPSRAEERKIVKLERRRRKLEEELLNTIQEMEKIERKYPWRRMLPKGEGTKKGK